MEHYMKNCSNLSQQLKKVFTKLEEIRLNADPQYSISFNDL